MGLRFVLGLLWARFRSAIAPVPTPGRFEIQTSPGGVSWVMDFHTRRKYPYADSRRAEEALSMLGAPHPPVMLSVPFSSVDARKAR